MGHGMQSVASCEKKIVYLSVLKEGKHAKHYYFYLDRLPYLHVWVRCSARKTSAAGKFPGEMVFHRNGRQPAQQSAEKNVY